MNHLESALTGKNNWWRYLLMILLVGFAGYYIIGILSIAGYAHSIEFFKGEDLSNNQWIFGLTLFCPLMALLLHLFLIKPIHKRSAFFIINGTKKIRWRRFFIAAFVWLLFLISYSLYSYFISPEEVVFQYKPATFFPLLVISFIIFPIQTAFEEFLFRGYLLQGFGVLTKSRIWACILSSLIFTSLHFLNPEAQLTGIIRATLNYGILAFFLSVITILDDGFEVAWGIHAIQNIYVVTIWNAKISSIPSDSLFCIDSPISYQGIVETLVCIVICLFILTKIFKWDWTIFKVKISPKN